MELGEVYKENGEIAYEKLFYFHYRVIPSQLFFSDLDGSGMVKLIAERFPEHIKEQKDVFSYDIKKQVDVLDEKIVVFNTQEIIIGNGYCVVYYYGNKRIIEDCFLRKLAIEYSYNTDYNNDL